jgi:hypothetical protein
MTDVDLEKKTYAVITFADFGRAMQKFSEKMGQKNNEAQLEFKADLKQTGQSKTINGFPAKEALLTLTVEGQDQQSGKTAAMNVVTQMWLAPNVSGYDEVKSFHSRMAQKLAFTPGMGGMAGMMGQQAGMAKGMTELYKETAKLDGVPVLQVIRMGGTMQGMSEAEMAGAQQAAAQGQQTEQQAPPPPTAGDVAGSAATGAAASRMGRFGGLAGGVGGLGGFGRRKKEPEQQQTQAQAQQQPPASSTQSAPVAGPTPAGTLMELTTEITSFSGASVDMAKLSVPEGFKQVEHEFAKQLK